MNVKVIKKNKDKNCNECDNLVPDQEYFFKMDKKPSLNSRVWFWKADNIGYYTDIIIKINGNCHYSRASKYYIDEIPE